MDDLSTSPENLSQYLLLLQDYSQVADDYIQLHAGEPLPQTSNDHLSLLTFNVQAYKGDWDSLIQLSLNMFHHFNLIEKFNLPEHHLRSLLFKVKEEYRDLPYHNFLHAIDVTQFAFFLLTTCGLAQYLHDLDIFALILGSLAHDIGHPGPQTATTVSLISPSGITITAPTLEECHSQLLHTIMESKESQVLNSFDAAQQEKLRKRLTANIRATDMSHHFRTFFRYSERLQECKTFSRDDDTDQEILGEMALKCSDLSNLVRPSDQVRTWAEAVIQELSLSQKTLPPALNLGELSPKNTSFLANSQVAFIDFIVKPLFGSLYITLPQAGECLRNLHQNRNSWYSQLFGANI